MPRVRLVALVLLFTPIPVLGCITVFVAAGLNKLWGVAMIAIGATLLYQVIVSVREYRKFFGHPRRRDKRKRPRNH